MMDDTVDPEKALARIEAQQRDADTPEDMPEKLAPVETFELDVEGLRGRRYVGRFYYRVPRIGDQFKIASLKASFIPIGSGGDSQAAQLADMVAYLTVCVRFGPEYPKPTWWDPMNAYDPTPYQELFRRCLDYEDRFLGRNQDDRGDGAGSAPPGEPGRDGEPPLEREVRPPAERRETLAGDGA